MLIPESFPNYFGFKGAIYLLPFFLIGTGIKNFKAHFNNLYFVTVISVVLLAGLIIQQLIWYGIMDLKLSSSSGLGLIIGVTGVIICLRIHFKVMWLVWMGNFAYTIFLFHSFGTSGGRIILNAIGIQNTTIVFLTSLILGLFLPIVVEYLLDRFGLTRMLFLGRAFNKSVKD
jgi:glucans biosynthesis protein C